MSNHVDEWLDGAERRVCSQPTPTGWDTGLCQDYCRKLSMWFASRLDARHTLRRWFGEQRKGTKGNEMTTHQEAAIEKGRKAVPPELRVPLRELVSMKVGLARDAERRKVPPCLECGASAPEEAERMCICGGDKDSCHGVSLWPDA